MNQKELIFVNVIYKYWSMFGLLNDGSKKEIYSIKLFIAFNFISLNISDIKKKKKKKKEKMRWENKKHQHNDQSKSTREKKEKAENTMNHWQHHFFSLLYQLICMLIHVNWMQPFFNISWLLKSENLLEHYWQ